MSRLPCLLAAAALVLPLPAYADCAQRIEAVESHPAILENPEGTAAAAEQAPAVPGGEEAATEEMVKNGGAVQEDGGTTVYQEGGPATPREQWFTNEKDKSAVLTHLDEARDARGSGDEQACLEAIEQAEAVLTPNDG
ncbi:hypothetical protein [Pelagibius sp. 7325]|uniref:hypothetical protein n=1 Tax=Pelagibius sp. 7325 TaxID=3131994 RepID=UPI0030ED7554